MRVRGWKEGGQQTETMIAEGSFLMVQGKKKKIIKK